MPSSQSKSKEKEGKAMTMSSITNQSNISTTVKWIPMDLDMKRMSREMTMATAKGKPQE